MFSKEDTWQLLEDEECLTADGFDDAVIGIIYGVEPKAVYKVNLRYECGSIPSRLS